MQRATVSEGESRSVPEGVHGVQLEVEWVGVHAAIPSHPKNGAWRCENGTNGFLDGTRKRLPCRRGFDAGFFSMIGTGIRPFVSRGQVPLGLARQMTCSCPIPETCRHEVHPGASSLPGPSDEASRSGKERACPNRTALYLKSLLPSRPVCIKGFRARR